MSGSDPSSPETSDPFHIPDRTQEMIGFLSAAAMTAVLPFAFSLPGSARNRAIVLSFALFALLMFLRGLEARKHRFNRIRSVTELRGVILRAGDEKA
jgi:asparagine N-glycosylation enzyme membrane subunit Stt3